ncbi:MAG TPA: hypothetical protein DEQ50_05275 [Lactobacillus sp.]|uniref:Uncharacterized protein n=1 Tax=Companilactobacillus nuruki TaxID=1993540 RepID=A0A2N7AU09_9LACO|nr:hypothetical protein CBP76_07185 [Companilactobacillus nuruki]HCD07666.1 hypothetical protein [Lactobacillus sp.]
MLGMVVGSINCKYKCGAIVYNSDGRTTGYLSNDTYWRLKETSIINGEECYSVSKNRWVPKKYFIFKGGLINEESNRNV